MKPHDQMLIIAAGRSIGVKRALQRWALRYCARLLSKLGGVHTVSAQLLGQLGQSQGRGAGGTLVGKPIPTRKPSKITIPDLPKINGDRRE